MINFKFWNRKGTTLDLTQKVQKLISEHGCKVVIALCYIIEFCPEQFRIAPTCVCFHGFSINPSQKHDVVFDKI